MHFLRSTVLRMAIPGISRSPTPYCRPLRESPRSTCTARCRSRSARGPSSPARPRCRTRPEDPRAMDTPVEAEFHRCNRIRSTQTHQWQLTRTKSLPAASSRGPGIPDRRSSPRSSWRPRARCSCAPPSPPARAAAGTGRDRCSPGHKQQEECKIKVEASDIRSPREGSSFHTTLC